MNLYLIQFDVTTYIVLAKNEKELLDLLHKQDNAFQKEVDRGIVYMWDLRNIEPVDISVVNQKHSGIVFSVSH